MSETGFDIVGVLKRLPHRYPLLLVDRVQELVADEREHREGHDEALARALLRG